MSKLTTQTNASALSTEAQGGERAAFAPWDRTVPQRRVATPSEAQDSILADFADFDLAAAQSIGAGGVGGLHGGFLPDDTASLPPNLACAGLEWRPPATRTCHFSEQGHESPALHVVAPTALERGSRDAAGFQPLSFSDGGADSFMGTFIDSLLALSDSLPRAESELAAIAAAAAATAKGKRGKKGGDAPGDEEAFRHFCSCPESFFWSRIYPKDASGVPRTVDSGLYVVRLRLNGRERSVPITDASPPGLFCQATDGSLWPLLVSKALYGAYAASGLPRSLQCLTAFCLSALGLLSHETVMSSTQMTLLLREVVLETPTLPTAQWVMGRPTILTDREDQLRRERRSNFHVMRQRRSERHRPWRASELQEMLFERRERVAKVRKQARRPRSRIFLVAFPHSVDDRIKRGGAPAAGRPARNAAKEDRGSAESSEATPAAPTGDAGVTHLSAPGARSLGGKCATFPGEKAGTLLLRPHVYPVLLVGVKDEVAESIRRGPRQGTRATQQHPANSSHHRARLRRGAPLLLHWAVNAPTLPPTSEVRKMVDAEDATEAQPGATETRTHAAAIAAGEPSAGSHSDQKTEARPEPQRLLFPSSEILAMTLDEVRDLGGVVICAETMTSAATTVSVEGEEDITTFLSVERRALDAAGCGAAAHAHPGEKEGTLQGHGVPRSEQPVVPPTLRTRRDQLHPVGESPATLNAIAADDRDRLHEVAGPTVAVSAAPPSDDPVGEKVLLHLHVALPGVPAGVTPAAPPIVTLLPVPLPGGAPAPPLLHWPLINDAAFQTMSVVLPRREKQLYRLTVRGARPICLTVVSAAALALGTAASLWLALGVGTAPEVLAVDNIQAPLVGGIRRCLARRKLVASRAVAVRLVASESGSCLEHVRLSLIDHATRQVTHYIGGPESRVAVLRPTSEGYTLQADSRARSSEAPPAGGSLKVFALCEGGEGREEALNVIHSPTPAPGVRFGGSYTPNRSLTLFRDVLSAPADAFPMSLELDLGHSGMRARMRVLDVGSGTSTEAADGRGIVCITELRAPAAVQRKSQNKKKKGGRDASVAKRQLLIEAKLDADAMCIDPSWVSSMPYAFKALGDAERDANVDGYGAVASPAASAAWDGRWTLDVHALASGVTMAADQSESRRQQAVVASWEERDVGRMGRASALASLEAEAVGEKGEDELARRGAIVATAAARADILETDAGVERLRQDRRAALKKKEATVVHNDPRLLDDEAVAELVCAAAAALEASGASAAAAAEIIGSERVFFETCAVAQVEDTARALKEWNVKWGARWREREENRAVAEKRHRAHEILRSRSMAAVRETLNKVVAETATRSKGAKGKKKKR